MAVACHWLLRPIFLFSITLPVAFSISESEALLKLKSSFKNAKALDSWTPSTVPCREGEEQWSGIVCSKGIVKGLYIDNMGLSGKIDVDALVELTHLRKLSIVNNSFSGKIPDFNRLPSVRGIYLSKNQFSGEIPPDYFDGMGALRKLWFSDNKFAGPMPPSLFQLPHLIELHVENNQFNGTIPSFDQPTLVEINLSFNKLEGEIPDSLLKFNGSSFSGNAGLCGKNLGVECRQVPATKATESNSNIHPPPPPADGGNKDDSTMIMAAVMLTLSVMLLSVAIVITVRFRRKRKAFNVLEKERVRAGEVQVLVSSSKREVDMSRRAGGLSHRARSNGAGELVLVNDEKGVFELPDLMKAAAEVLGNGGLGSSYKAMMADGATVVVKRMRETNAMARAEFDTEVRRLGRLRHINVLTPLAYHYRKDEKLLVYENIPRGSLLFLLHGDRGPSYDEFNWHARLKIVQGIARGIGYLHTELAHLELPHGNLKSSNILISPENEALVSEFGFCTMINNDSLAQALFAYKAPEAIQSAKVTPKCDVYCLGIIIFEILTGKFPSQYLSNGEGGIDVVQWVESACSERRVTDLFDPEIASSINSLGEMEQLLEIGRACTQSNPGQRLEMREAVRRILEIQSNGNMEARTLHILPTLKHGYAESEAYGKGHESVLDNFDYGISGPLN